MVLKEQIISGQTHVKRVQDGIKPKTMKRARLEKQRTIPTWLFSLPYPFFRFFGSKREAFYPRQFVLSSLFLLKSVPGQLRLRTGFVHFSVRNDRFHWRNCPFKGVLGLSAQTVSVLGAILRPGRLESSFECGQGLLAIYVESITSSMASLMYRSNW